MSNFFWFSDAQWARIGPLLPTDTRGMARVDDRRVLSGIVHALRNGGRWADLRIPMKAATDSDGKRPPVPIQYGHFGRGSNWAS